MNYCLYLRPDVDDELKEFLEKHNCFQSEVKDFPEEKDCCYSKIWQCIDPSPYFLAELKLRSIEIVTKLQFLAREKEIRRELEDRGKLMWNPSLLHRPHRRYRRSR